MYKLSFPNPGASQQDVKDALTVLKNAKKKLHGKNQKLRDVHKKNNLCLLA